MNIISTAKFYKSNRQAEHDITKPSEEDFKEILLSEMKAYKSNMFRIANSILKNYADAEDAVSESFLIAYTNFHSLRDIEKFKSWIIKILVRECYKLQKKRRRFSDYKKMPEIGVMDNYATGELWEIVSRLDTKFRTIIILFYYEDMDIKTIANSLSLSQGTVKSRLSRGREKLRQLLETNGGFEDDKF